MNIFAVSLSEGMRTVVETKEFVYVCIFLMILFCKIFTLYCLKLEDCNGELPIEMPRIANYSVLSFLCLIYLFLFMLKHPEIIHD